MNQLRIGIREERRIFQPDDELVGAAGWELDTPPKSVEVRLLWFTRGKGTEDVGVVDTVTFENPQAAEARPFRFQLPATPYSFSGKLISLLWAVELIALPSKDSTRAEFALAPDGQEVRLDRA
ncbi:MAG: hypothetical protein HZA90_12915 [Verrucomicrobia bacterium]|nr:hypothetical protein [Verrucomicrobiota bacterium]